MERIEKRKRTAIIAVLLFLGLFILPLILQAPIVSAQTEPIFGETIWAPLFKYIIGVPDQYARDTQWIMMIFAVWLIIFVALSDLISVFTAFNPGASWIIGLALAVIAANSGLVATIGVGLFGFAATLGVIAVVGILISSFVVAFLLHWGIGGRLQAWIQRRREMLSAEMGGSRIIQGLRTAAALGREARRAGRRIR